MKKNNWLFIILLQGLNVLFSLSGVAVKITSTFWEKYGILSKEVLAGMSIVLLIMVFYAFFWQKILVKIPLNVAYLNKGTVIFWTLLWSALFFAEEISVMNVIGILFVFVGIGLVNAND